MVNIIQKVRVVCESGITPTDAFAACPGLLLFREVEIEPQCQENSVLKSTDGKRIIQA